MKSRHGRLRLGTMLPPGQSAVLVVKSMRKARWAMSRLVFVCLALSPVLAFADAPKHRFVHIYGPREEDKFSNTIPNIAGMGLFYFFDPEWKPADLRIRIRIYRPIDDDFELFLEGDAEIGPPLLNDPATLQFGINLKNNKAAKPGRYLYRVDCFDIRDEKEKLLASNAVFITFVDPKKAAGKDEPVSVRHRPARAQHVSRAGRRSALPSTGTHSRIVSSGLRRPMEDR